MNRFTAAIVAVGLLIVLGATANAGRTLIRRHFPRLDAWLQRKRSTQTVAMYEMTFLLFFASQAVGLFYPQGRAEHALLNLSGLSFFIACLLFLRDEASHSA